MKMTKGFTVIELVMIIVLLSILTVVTIPRFVDLKASAEKAGRDSVEAVVESGAQVWMARHLVGSDPARYPTQYPPTWEACLDPEAVSDIKDRFSIDYDPATGKVVSIGSI
ncbi:MAG: hypothetical protein ABH875_03045 [Candidatus Omnitrophota bacterium]